MRKEAVYTVLLNATLFKGMRCFSTQDPRYIRFSVFEGNTTTHYNLRVSAFGLLAGKDVFDWNDLGVECQDCGGVARGDQCAHSQRVDCLS